jgi:hypothetical protein
LNAVLKRGSQSEAFKAESSRRDLQVGRVFRYGFLVQMVFNFKASRHGLRVTVFKARPPELQGKVFLVTASGLDVTCEYVGWFAYTEALTWMSP